PDLQAIGIRSKIRVMERAALTTAWREKKLKNLIVGITGAAGNAATRLEAYVSKEGAYTSGIIPEVEDLFQRQARELDVKRREALIHQIQQILHDRMTHVPIYELAFTWGIGPRHERRRRDGLQDGPPVDVELGPPLLDARMPLPHERPVGALAQARRDDPAIVVDAGIRVAAIEVLRGLLDAVPGVRFGRAGRRRGGALADLGPDVDDHELLDELGALGREVDRVASAHRQADEDERFETEGLDDAADVVERDGRVVDVGRIAVAVSALVEGEDVKMRLQRDAERVPGVRVPREAVQEEQ